MIRLFSMIFFGLLYCASFASQAIELQSDTELATAGYYRLSWINNGQAVELQESNNPQFQDTQTLYLGHDGATLISGKSDGQWYYRLRLQNEPQWSTPVKVTVEHHSLTRAVGFMSLGLLVFLATILLIVFGGKKVREAPDEQ